MISNRTIVMLLCFAGAGFLMASQGQNEARSSPVVTDDTTVAAAPSLIEIGQDAWRSMVQPPLTAPAQVSPSDEMVAMAARHLPKFLVVSLSDRQVRLQMGDEVLATYPVAIGKDGWETPSGEFYVTHMMENPAWRHPVTRELIDPGPDSPIGTRWIEFWREDKNAFGFHGTNEADLIGEAVSHGCLRMHNEDVEALYASVYPGMPVMVVP